MEEFHHSWFSILNRTYVPPHRITHSTVRQNTLEAHAMSPAIQFLRLNTLSIQRQELHSLRNLLGPRPGPQSLFQFGPSKGPRRQRTLNRRRNKNQLQSRKHVSPPQNGLAVLARSPSSPKYRLQTSTRMNQIMTEVLSHMTIQTQMSIIASLHHPLPHLHHHLALPLLHSHRIHMHLHHQPSAFFNQILAILLVIHHFVHGPTMMIKS